MVSFSFSKNIGRPYENIVFNELIRRGKSIYFLNEGDSEGDSECDFIVKDGTSITGAYQVCYEPNEKNLQREVSGLVMACRKFSLKEGYIITESTTRTVIEDCFEIRIIPITEFLFGLADPE